MKRWRFSVLLMLLLPATLQLAAKGTAVTGPSTTAATPHETRSCCPAVMRAFMRDRLDAGQTMGLLFTVTEFGSEEQASHEMGIWVEDYLDFLSETNESAELARSAAPPFGDETMAYSGEVETGLDEPVSRVSYAFLVVQFGRFIRFDTAAGIANVPLRDLVRVMEGTNERRPGDGSTVVGPDGLRSGGLWDLVPRTEDLPDGFSFYQEEAMWRADPSAAASSP